MKKRKLWKKDVSRERMRKNVGNLICWLLIMALILSASACGNAGSGTEDSRSLASAEKESEVTGSTDDSAAPEQTKETSDESPSDGGHAGETARNGALVIYFSRTGEQYTVGEIDHGNTAIVAEIIAEETGADLFEVTPEDDRYPMTYDALTDVARREQNEKARPPYRIELPDLAGYDTIFIGAPVWWGDWPMIMYTVFENNDFSGKTLIPFSTHEGSGLSGFDRKLENACPGATVGKGLAIRGNDCQNAEEKVRDSVKGWLQEIWQP